MSTESMPNFKFPHGLFLELTVGLALLIATGCRDSQENQLPQTALARTEVVPRSETVVSPQWVKALLDFQTSDGKTARPANYFNNRAVILEASWAKSEKAKDYLAGHIPSAIHLNTDDVENGYPRWLLRPVSELHQVIGQLGITPETTVVIYSKQTIAAARLWWVVMYAGVSDVRFLNGGFEAWAAAGFPAETAIGTPQPVTFSAKVREEFLATTDYVRAHLDDAKVQLADARSREEFAGQISGYDYINFKGRLPGSINVGNADDSARLYQNPDGTLRSFGKIQTMWNQAGIENNREVIFYCGSGWRSSLAFLYAWAMGLEHIRNYSDGWAGWSTNYIADDSAKGGTPGWRQQHSPNPVIE